MANTYLPLVTLPDLKFYQILHLFGVAKFSSEITATRPNLLMNVRMPTCVGLQMHACAVISLGCDLLSTFASLCSDPALPPAAMDFIALSWDWPVCETGKCHRGSEVFHTST